MAVSLLVCGAAGLGLGLLAATVSDVVEPTTIFIFAMAATPVYAWRLGLSEVPEKFDFERFEQEVDRQTQIVQHAAVAVVAVSAGTLIGVVTSIVAESSIPILGVGLGMIPAYVVSWVVGVRLLATINDDYRIETGEAA
jgi:hypothetical protein